MCGQLVNEKAVSVVYKNNYSFGVKIVNIYMVSSYDVLIYIVMLIVEFRLSGEPTGVISVIWVGTHHTTMVQPLQKRGRSEGRNIVSKSLRLTSSKFPPDI